MNLKNHSDGSLDDQIIAFIAEVTVDTHHTFREQLERLQGSTRLYDQQWLIEEIEKRFKVRVIVSDPWDTTIGQVLQGVRARLH